MSSYYPTLRGKYGDDDIPEPSSDDIRAIEQEGLSRPDMSGDSTLSDRFNQANDDLASLSEAVLRLEDDAAALHDEGLLDDDFFDQLTEVFDMAREVPCG